MENEMKQQLFLTLSFFAVFTVGVNGSGDAEVKEAESQYSCCDRTLDFDPHCEHSWYNKSTHFAHFDDGAVGCLSPCKNISNGKMTLDSCVTVQDKILCRKGKFVEEQRTMYSTQPCNANKPKAAGNQHGPHEFLIIVFFSLLVGRLMDV